jgi:DNA-binding response OmpR family regulator
MTHILLIEDEVKLAKFIELGLNYQGYQVSVAYDGLTAARFDPVRLDATWFIRLRNLPPLAQ